jgi:hypothetical protein
MRLRKESEPTTKVAFTFTKETTTKRVTLGSYWTEARADSEFYCHFLPSPSSDYLRTDRVLRIRVGAAPANASPSRGWHLVADSMA